MNQYANNLKGSAPMEAQDARNPNSLGVIIGVLAVEVDRLDSDVGTLTDRLSPIRVPKPEGGYGIAKEKAVVLSPFAESLNVLIAKITLIHQQLQQLTGEIEL